MNFLVTGGAGFIGSAVIRLLLSDSRNKVVNLDNLTYAGNLESLKSIEKSKNYFFEKVDICNQKEVKRIFQLYSPNKVLHLAAESHVDRSILEPKKFLETNVIGTYVMLDESKTYWDELPEEDKNNFIFQHISTDEVYGDLGVSKERFTELTPYDPSSPYSASKASSDHLVRAWSRTYDLPTVITNCSNNYGPYQFPEKLIPLTIKNAIQGKEIPVYGSGLQIRDWLYVEDHAKALVEVMERGAKNQTYNIGGNNEKANIDVVKNICMILDEIAPSNYKHINKYADLIKFVEDRPGHDIRYSIDATKIANDLGWKPDETFESGIRKTVEWYLNNQEWVQAVENDSAT